MSTCPTARSYSFSSFVSAGGAHGEEIGRSKRGCAAGFEVREGSFTRYLEELSVLLFSFSVLFIYSIFTARVSILPHALMPY